MEHIEDIPSADAVVSGADAPQPEPGPADVVSRAEFNKVVSQRQAAKEKVRQLSSQVDELQRRLGESGGADALAGASDDGSGDGAAEGSSSSAAPRAHGTQSDNGRLPEAMRSQLTDLQRRKETLERRLADLLVDQELRVAAARANAVNPDQVVALLRGRVRMAETSAGRFEATFLDAAGQSAIDGDKPIRDVRQFVETFLARPENANLLRPSVIPGSGARQAGAAVSHMDPMPQSRAEFLALPAPQRLAVANRMTRQQRDDLLGRAATEDGGYI